MSKRRLPAEWEPQDAVQLTWPHAENGWPAGSVPEQLFVAICQAISPHQDLLISCRDVTAVEKRLAAADVDLSRILLYQQASNDCWIRDHGPLGIVTDRGCELLNFRFNGWGGKYPCDLDNAISRSLANQQAYADTPMHDIDFVLEGGSLDSNGVDTLLTTSRCLLNPNRNGQVSREEIEKRLCDYFGMTHIHWLDHGEIAGDDTDGHIDMLARFCDQRRIIYCSSEDPTDSHHAELQAMKAELETLRCQQGRAYDLIPLPLPRPIYDEAGHRLPASYANFLIINEAVLLPVYGQESDHEASRILQGCFPGREIITIDCLPLIQQYGSLHCASLQLMSGASGKTG